MTYNSNSLKKYIAQVPEERQEIQKKTKRYNTH